MILQKNGRAEGIMISSCPPAGSASHVVGVLPLRIFPYLLIKTNVKSTGIFHFSVTSPNMNRLTYRGK